MPDLVIHLHHVDGSVERFRQSDPRQMKYILDDFQPARIFTSEKIVFADGPALIVFPASRVVRLDLVPEPAGRLPLPPGTVNAVELTPPEFEAVRQNPDWSESWNRMRTREDSVVVCLEVEMAAQPPLYLAMETLREPLADPQTTIPYLYTASALCVRLHQGGVAALNLAHLTRFTVLPGSPPPPLLQAWPAGWTRDSLSRPLAERPDDPENRRPLPSSLTPDDATKHGFASRELRENAAALEERN